MGPQTLSTGPQTFLPSNYLDDLRLVQFMKKRGVGEESEDI